MSTSYYYLSIFIAVVIAIFVSLYPLPMPKISFSNEDMNSNNKKFFYKSDDHSLWFKEYDSPLWPGQGMALKVNKILHREQSKFQDVIVFESTDYGTVLVLDGAIQLTTRDEFSYQEMLAHLPMCSHPNPQEVLVIGGGDGGILREVLKHDTVKHVTLVDIDEAVIRLSAKYLPSLSNGAFNDSRVTVLVDDGAAYLKNNTGKYDVIITDSSDPIGPASVLFSESYFELMRDALKEKGVVATQGECFWLHLELIGNVLKSARHLFGTAEYAYTTIPTYPSGSIGFIVASKEKKDLSKPSRLLKNVENKYYNKDIHEAAFVLPQFVHNAIKKDE